MPQQRRITIIIASPLSSNRFNSPPLFSRSFGENISISALKVNRVQECYVWHITKVSVCLHARWLCVYVSMKVKFCGNKLCEVCILRENVIIKHLQPDHLSSFFTKRFFFGLFISCFVFFFLARTQYPHKNHKWNHIQWMVHGSVFNMRWIWFKRRQIYLIGTANKQYHFHVVCVFNKL